MSRRASAFASDLGELDSLDQLPRPAPAGAPLDLTIPAGNQQSTPAPPPVAAPIPPATAADATPVATRATQTQAEPPTVPARGPAPTAATKVPDASAGPRRTAAETTPPAEVPTPAAAKRVDGGGGDGGLRTAVRLPAELAEWIWRTAEDRDLTTASVVISAALGGSAPAAPDVSHLDGLMQTHVGRGKAKTIPMALRLTGAQRELLDDLAEQWRCTRTAVVVTVVRAAMRESG